MKYSLIKRVYPSTTVWFLEDENDNVISAFESGNWLTHMRVVSQKSNIITFLVETYYDVKFS